MVVVPIGLIVGLFRGLYRGDWELFRRSIRFWGTCFAVILVLGFCFTIVSAGSTFFGGNKSTQQPSSQVINISPQISTRTPDYPATITALAPTRLPDYAATNRAALPQSTDLPSYIYQFTRIPDRKMYVCLPAANVRSGPGTSYAPLKQLTSDWSVTVYGTVGEWYYVGYDEQHRDQFMHQSVLCNQPNANASTPAAISSSESEIMRGAVKDMNNFISTQFPSKPKKDK